MLVDKLLMFFICYHKNNKKTN